MKKELLKELKNEAKLRSLFKTEKLDSINKIVFGKKSFIFVFFILIVLYLINVLYSLLFNNLLPFINIVEITEQLSYNLVDKAASHIIAIVSLTFIVLSILINSIKEKNNINYKLVLSYLKFYPITFFIFSFILSLIFQSTFRLNFSAKIIRNIALLNSYLLMLSFILILYLFIRTLECIDPTKLSHLFSKELFTQTKKQILLYIIGIKSEKRFLSVMEKNEFEQITYFKEKEFKLYTKKDIYLTDVKENKLMKIKSKKEDIALKPIHIGQYFEDETKFAESNENIDELQRTFCFKKKQLVQTNYIEYFNLLIDRLNYSIKTKDIDLLEKTLSNFDTIHDLVIEYKDYLDE